MSEKHLTDKMKRLGHHEEAAEKGGACLWEHGTNVPRDEKNSCSYRWQAHLRAWDDRTKIYHLYRTALAKKAIDETIDVGRRSKTSKRLVPSYYTYKLDRPEPGDWDVNGPLEKDLKRGNGTVVKEGKNFHHDTWPYWNNAHHIIPKGTLMSTMGREFKSPRGLGTFVIKALLEAKYNVNERINMMFLPQDKEIAKILRIPRHLQMRFKDAPGIKSSVRDHRVYSDHASREIVAICNEFKEKYDDTYQKDKEKHPKATAKAHKERLEKLSDELYEMITSFVKPGGPSDGLSLDAIVPPPKPA